MSNIIGVRNNSTIVPYSAATKRTKEVAITVTGTGWSTTLARAIFYADSNNSWRMVFNVRGSVAPTARTSYTAAISNIKFQNTANFYQAISAGNDGGNGVQAYAIPNTGGITAQHASESTSVYEFSGDVKLEEEPITYTIAANMEGVGAVDVYIAPASATVDGIVNRSAQTLAGNKTFSGFTAFGSGNLGLRCKKLSGTTPAAGAAANIAHGLSDGDEIVAVNAVCRYAADVGVYPGNSVTGNVLYSVRHNNTNIVVEVPASGGSTVASQPIDILIWYQQ